MTDGEVMAFVASGYAILEGVVSDEIRMRYEALSDRDLSPLVETRAFVDGVLLHPQVAGVARSLLGQNFLVPTRAHHHLYHEPHPGQSWHSDGLSETGFGVTHLQCYYYPQEVAIADGPTMILPCSAFRFVDREAISHYGDIVGQLSLAVPAGTVVMGHYGVWHKAGPKLNSRKRGMIKFSYFRSTAPRRDWLVDSDEIPEYCDPPRAPYLTEIEHYRERIRCRKTWEWLCGRETQRDQTQWGLDGVLASGARPLAEMNMRRLTPATPCGRAHSATSARERTWAAAISCGRLSRPADATTSRWGSTIRRVTGIVSGTGARSTRPATRADRPARVGPGLRHASAGVGHQ